MATCNPSNLIFSFAQMIAHHTTGGCPLQTGDLLGSGTVSGAGVRQRGCMMESARAGTVPYDLESPLSGKRIQRNYLQDGDIVEFSARVTGKDRGNIGFGTCSGQVLPAN